MGLVFLKNSAFIRHFAIYALNLGRIPQLPCHPRWVLGALDGQKLENAAAVNGKHEKYLILSPIVPFTPKLNGDRWPIASKAYVIRETSFPNSHCQLFVNRGLSVLIWRIDRGKFNQLSTGWPKV